jgi:hypothetical protein
MFSGCKTASMQVAEKPLALLPATPTIKLASSESKFYQNIPYSEYKEDVFDIYVPNGKTPAALLINIHGGGFVGGDKAQGISAALVNSLMAKNIAFASLNYRFITEDNQGVLKCMNDCKRALQFIRYHSKTFNIDKSNVALMGGSAGAGTSLWLAFNADMADKKNADPVLRESTRVKGAVALSTQATYDVLNWPDAVFWEYKSKGFNLKNMLRVAPEKLLLNFYGFKTLSDTGTVAGKAYRKKVDMLALMSSDDPEFYAENASVAYTMPKTLGELEHHPLHAKALMDRAKQVGVKSKINIPPMKIDTRSGETRDRFILRILGKE